MGRKAKRRDQWLSLIPQYQIAGRGERTFPTGRDQRGKKGRGSPVTVELGLQKHQKKSHGFLPGRLGQRVNRLSALGKGRDKKCTLFIKTGGKTSQGDSTCVLDRLQLCVLGRGNCQRQNLRWNKNTQEASEVRLLKRVKKAITR